MWGETIFCCCAFFFKYFYSFLYLFFGVCHNRTHTTLKKNKGFQENIYLALLRTRSLDCVSLVGCCCCFGAKTVVKTFLVFYFVGGEVNFFESFRFFSKLKWLLLFLFMLWKYFSSFKIQSDVIAVNRNILIGSTDSQIIAFT